MELDVPAGTKDPNSERREKAKDFTRLSPKSICPGLLARAIFSPKASLTYPHEHKDSSPQSSSIPSSCIMHDGAFDGMIDGGFAGSMESYPVDRQSFLFASRRDVLVGPTLLSQATCDALKLLVPSNDKLGQVKNHHDRALLLLPLLASTLMKRG